MSTKPTLAGYLLNKLIPTLLRRKKMDHNLLELSEIQPLTQNWTTIVQVIEKQKAQLSKAGKRYQKLVFVNA